MALVHFPAPGSRQHITPSSGLLLSAARARSTVDPNECRPRCRALALWCGRQRVTLQDLADRLIADLIPQIGQRPRNAVIAPITVLIGHANDQLLDFSLDPRPARASTGLRAIEFAGDQLAWNTKTGRMLSDSVAPLRVVLSARFCRTCSCITRSISGCRGRTRTFRGVGMLMTGWFTA